MLLCTGFKSILAHYETFVDKAVMEKVNQGFRIWEEMEGVSNLWIDLGGIAGSRYAQLILADRVAAKIQNRPSPARVLSGLPSYLLGGIDPGLIQIPKRTIAINAIAGLALLGWLTGLI